MDCDRDFNTVLHHSDQTRERVVATSSKGGLRSVMNDHGLIDLGFGGHPYTWNNITKEGA